MSTRSIIGTTTGTTFEGLYCHFDGYPTSQVPALAQIITRDGHDALPILTGATQAARGGATASWESLVAEMPAADTELPFADRSDWIESVPAKDRDPGIGHLYTHLSMGRDNARDSIVEGYGTVHLDSPIRFSGTLSDPHAQTGWCEWAYLFTEDLTLVVFEIADGLVEVGRFTREDLAALADGDESIRERVGHAECGEDYSRCSHYAWVHDDGVPQASRRLSMREWLGIEPLRPMSATGAVVGRRRYEFTGSGGSRHGNWEVSVKGQKAMVPVFRLEGNTYAPLPGVELIYPPTRETVAA